MTIDEKQLHDLLEESQDLHFDAMSTVSESLSDFNDLRADQLREGFVVEPEELVVFNQSRKTLWQRLGFGNVSHVAAASLFGAGLAAVVAQPASAAESLDIQMLQTASSLEILAVATYGAALTLPFIIDGNPVVKAFAETTMKQHDEHMAAFQAMTKAMGGTVQTVANPKYAPIVETAKLQLKAPIDVVKLAATLEQVATETYLSDLAMFADTKARSLVASVMGVECQHLATLRAVGALLEGGAPELIKIPLGVDIAKLPAAAGSIAFPEAFSGITMASPAAEGAVL